MGRGFYVNFSVPELRSVLNNIAKYDAKTAAKIEDAVSNSTKAIRKGAVSRIHSDSGYLKKHTTSSFNRKDIVGAIRAKAPHAHLVEFGARATVVKPGSKKKAMTIDSHGIRRYAVKAQIPKRSERPFMRPAFEDEKPNLLRNLKEAVRKP